MAGACIDTQLLIWGVQQTANPGQEEMISRSLALFAELAKEQIPVIVPSIAIGEFLLGVPDDKQQRYLDLFSRRFIVMPYDLIAARHFARIWQRKHEAGVMQALREAGTGRQVLRADTMIVATALAAGATRIYSSDGHIKSLSEGFLAYYNPADLVLQTNFLRDEPTS